MANTDAAAAALAAQAQGSIDQTDIELRSRMCNAEIAAVVEKYGLAVAIQRLERFVPGVGLQVEYSFNFVPRPKGNGKAANS